MCHGLRTMTAVLQRSHITLTLLAMIVTWLSYGEAEVTVVELPNQCFKFSCVTWQFSSVFMVTNNRYLTEKLGALRVETKPGVLNQNHAVFLTLTVRVSTALSLDWNWKCNQKKCDVPTFAETYIVDIHPGDWTEKTTVLPYHDITAPQIYHDTGKIR